MYEAYLGPLGRMVAVRTSQTSPVEHTRAGAEYTLATGQRRTYRAPRSARRWKWDIPWATDSEIDDLLALEQGAYGPPPWRYYDPMAAATNMFPDVIAAAGSGTAPFRWFATAQSAVSVGGALDLPDGRRFPVSLSPNTTLQFPIRRGLPDPIPVFPGRPYTASAYVEDGSGTLSLLWRDVDGGSLGRVDSDSGTGRLVATGTAPEGAAGVLVEVSIGTPGQALSLRTGGYVSTPDSPVLSVTGDLDIRARVALDTYTSDDTQVMVAKYLSEGNQRGYEFSVRPGKKLALTWSTGGAGSSDQFRRATSIDTIPASDGEPIYLRAAMDVENDDGVWEVIFFYSFDEDPTSWVQLGPPIRGTEPTEFFDNDADLLIGRNGTAAPAPGDYYRVEVLSGIDGTAVANPDFTLSGNWEDGDTSGVTRSDAAGTPWTLEENAEIRARVVPILGSRIGAFQLTETDTAVTWRAGMGIPWVSVTGLDTLIYSRLTNREKYRSVAVTLDEVS